MQTQVIPTYVNQPKRQGGKYGNIKLQDGTLYMVPVNMLGSFAPNTAANIDFEVQNWGQPGQQSPFNVVTAINGQGITGQAGPVKGGDRPAPVPQNVPAAPQGKTDESESIFVTGIVGRAMGSGKFTAEDIHTLTRCAAQAWKDRHKQYGHEQDHGLGNNPVSGEKGEQQPDPYGEPVPF